MRLFLFAVLLTLFCVCFLAIRQLVTFGGLRFDVPNERSSHSHATARGGGVAFAALITGAWLVFLCDFFNAEVLLATSTGNGALSTSQWRVLTGGLVLLTALGVLDDLKGLSARFRFSVQLLVGILVAIAGVRWREIAFAGDSIALPVWISIPLTVLWIVWNTNMYNFMDGIDGIAGLTGVVVALAFAFLGWAFAKNDIFMAAIVTVPCLLAFLRFNLFRARIFMGDSGSLPLGYTFSVLALGLHVGTNGVFTIFHGILLLAPFLFDATFTLIRRAARGAPFWEAHRDHIYQKLSLRLGSHGTVASIYAGLAVLSAVVASLHLAGKH
jgi:UDP-N-acetylmuramyl pentapeptide phosphotransferase/UDP-N-acetylglucosamine-1-phosphate transferase